MTSSARISPVRVEEATRKLRRRKFPTNNRSRKSGSKKVHHTRRAVRAGASLLHRSRPHAHTPIVTEQQAGALSNCRPRHVGHPRTRPPSQHPASSTGRPMIAPNNTFPRECARSTEEGKRKEAKARNPTSKPIWRPRWSSPPASPTRLRSTESQHPEPLPLG